MASIIKEPPRQSGLEGIFRWAKEVISRAILDGTLIEGVSASTSGETLNHRLGRTPRGVVVVKSTTTDTVSASSFTESSVTLTSSSGTPEVSVWIF